MPVNYTDIYSHPAYHYAEDVVSGKIIAGEQIVTQCQRFLDEIALSDKSEWYFDLSLFKKVSVVLGFILMAEGRLAGQPVDEHLTGFQWFFLVSIFCWRHSENHELRRYKTATMLIGRKNGKTFIVALIFILLLLTEPKYSQFYSVAPNLELSAIIKAQMDNLIDNSPRIKDHFIITKKLITCRITKSTFQPLATSNNRMDARAASVFVADEVGALANNYPIQAMRSSQTQVANPLGIIISTAYDSLENPMTEEVAKAEEKTMPGDKYDPEYFAMLYRPDKPKEWATNEDELLKANPIAQDIPAVKEAVDKMKSDAIDYPAERPNFLTKFMNIFVDGGAGEAFASESEIKSAILEQGYDWDGKDVFVGLDFAESHDNFGFSMVTYDDSHDAYVAKSWGFYPAGREAEKSKIESFDYAHANAEGWAYPSGGETIDYNFVENFFFDLEENYGVTIKGVGYDKWNARSTIAKFMASGYDGIDIPQNGKGLYPGTKLLREAIQNKRFFFDKNDMLEQNFMNAVMVTDSNLSYFLNKKKSNGKIDMAASIVDAMSLWETEEFEDAMFGSPNIRVM